MPRPFICFIKYKDNKYDIVYTDNETTPHYLSFRCVLDKIVEFMSKALEVNFDHQQHIFELIDSVRWDDKSTIIKEFEQRINHLSAILIREKPHHFINHDSVLPANDSDIQYLHVLSNDIDAFKMICSCIQNGTNFKSGTKTKKWDKIASKVVEKSDSYKDFNGVKCRNIIFELIKFYCKVFNKVNFKMDNESQIIFDKLKFIHSIKKVRNLFNKTIEYELKRISETSEIQDYINFGFDVYETVISEPKIISIE